MFRQLILLVSIFAFVHSNSSIYEALLNEYTNLKSPWEVGTFAQFLKNIEVDQRNFIPPLGRIINGSPAVQGQFPYALVLLIKSANESFLCSATLIKKNWILTAGHCLENRVNGSAIGAIVRSNSTSTVRIDFTQSNMFIHPQYLLNSSVIANDIALIKLPSEFPCSGNIRTIDYSCSTCGMSSDLNGVEVTIAGYGMTDPNVALTSIALNYASMNIITNSQCQPFFGNPIYDHIMCGDTNVGRGLW